jgi:hypothetical protein
MLILKYSCTKNTLWEITENDAWWRIKEVIGRTTK